MRLNVVQPLFHKKQTKKKTHTQNKNFQLKFYDTLFYFDFNAIMLKIMQGPVLDLCI